jgi:hypothetical protein
VRGAAGAQPLGKAADQTRANTKKAHNTTATMYSGWARKKTNFWMNATSTNMKANPRAPQWAATRPRVRHSKRGPMARHARTTSGSRISGALAMSACSSVATSTGIRR